jgi:hypothetical protein
MVEPAGTKTGVAEGISVTGQTVVYKAMILVITELIGQSAVDGGQAVIV